jgi:hypothetical protein
MKTLISTNFSIHSFTMNKQQEAPAWTLQYVKFLDINAANSKYIFLYTKYFLIMQPKETFQYSNCSLWKNFLFIKETPATALAPALGLVQWGRQGCDNSKSVNSSRRKK